MSVTEPDTARYALALTAPEETRALSIAILDDPELAQAVWRWERELQPLADVLRERRPPRAAEKALERLLFPGSDTRALRRARSFWRSLAMLFLALFLLVLGVFMIVLARPDLVGLG